MDLTASPPFYAWCEGKKDEGIGEGVTIEFYEPTKIDHIALSPGVQRTEKLFAKNSQITKVTVIADANAQTVALTPKYGETIASWPKASSPLASSPRPCRRDR